MDSQSRSARVRAFAKINLTLKVLHKRPDNYHELRTVFQTISLADTLDISYTPGRGSRVELASSIEIPNNLVLRAANLLMDTLRIRGQVSIRLTKRIPMGGGLGGGSTDAAAVLLALPFLAGKAAPMERLLPIAAELGSDVPFFLLGGTALGLGRGEELYAFPEPASATGVLLTPHVHVSTAEAYAALNRGLTSLSLTSNTNNFQSFGWIVRHALPVEAWTAFCQNDFEEVVFQQHPLLKSLKKKLLNAGARPAMMTGSGSAVYGMFRSRQEAQRARRLCGYDRSYLFSLVSRARYQAAWRRSLGREESQETWPPQGRYAR